jgi:hypothetical protein
MVAPLARVLLAAALLMIRGVSAAAPAPQTTPAAAPDQSKKLVADLTQWLELDAAQQEKLEPLVRDFFARNEKIQQRWRETNKVRPEELKISQGRFQNDLVSILTPEQKKKYKDTVMRVMMKGKTPPTPPKPPS